jgi:hypothetical protein
VHFPFDNGGSNTLDAGSYVVGSAVASGALHMVLLRTPGGVINRTPNTFNNLLNVVAPGDDIYFLAIHAQTEGRVYLADGTALSDGETVQLGGIRIGVQWFYKDYGSAGQVTNFGASNTFRVGGGELMVYRNGIKAKASLAVWRGQYGVSGTLDVVTYGPIADDDDYIEEDSTGVPAPDVGNRIIWIRDTDSPVGAWETGPPATYRPEATHDPPVQWPQSDDALEAFVGVQATAPTIDVPEGIYGFETVWTKTASTIRTAGGTVAFQGAQYKNDGSTPLDLVLNGTNSPAQKVPGDPILVTSTWNYVYLGVSPSTGVPTIWITGTPPDDSAGGAGKHPLDGSLFFLTSVYLIDFNNFQPFSKTGSWVQLGGNVVSDISGALGAAVAAPGVWTPVDLSSFLPATFAGHLRAYLRMATTTLGDGNQINLLWRLTNSSHVTGELFAIKPANDASVAFDIDAIAPAGVFDILVNAGATWTGPDASYLRGYAEGRATSGDTLGA